MHALPQVGTAEGLNDGPNDGVILGLEEGSLLGFEDGFTEGVELGLEEGSLVGTMEGEGDGIPLGIDDGASDFPLLLLDLDPPAMAEVSTV